MATRRGSKIFESAAKAPWAKRFGLLRSIAGLDIARDNNYADKWSNAADTGDIEGVRVTTSDEVFLGGSAVIQPTWRPIFIRMPINGDIVTKAFHTFNYDARIKAIYQIHETAGNDAAAVTLQITKDVSGVAPGAGVAVQSGTFNLKGTAKTLQTATLATNPATLECAAGNRLSVKLTGTATTAAAVCIVVWVQYYKNVQEFSIHAASGNADQAFFIANRPYTVLGARYSAATAEVTGTTLKIQLTQDTSTDAPGAGTDLLTNSSNGGFLTTSAANIPLTGTFASSPSLATGDRLSIDYSGSATELAGIVITVAIAAQAERIEVPFWDIDTDVAEVVQLIADRDYEIIEAREVHAVAAGSTATAQLELATGTTAIGSGVTLMASTADLNGTANTVQVLAPTATLANRIIPQFGRMGLDYNHTEQSLAGLVTTTSLRAI